MGKRIIAVASSIAIAVPILAAFTLIIGNYFHFNDSLGTAISGVLVDLRASLSQERKDVCPPGYITIKVPGGHVYRAKAVPSRWLDIYDSYPKSARGKEIIYKFLDDGNISLADKYLHNIHTVDRFKPVTIKPPITWTEDPYESRYWRFIFYSLRPTRHLLYAGRHTKDVAYNEKLIEVVQSFIDDGIDKPYAWGDKHAVAFRAMVLTNIWWKLREQNALPVDLSTKILQALKTHGDFLADERNYESQHNHGINEAAALFLVAINFPDLPGADEWLAIAKSRLTISLDDLVDSDGVLVENSPYYHFYTLRKYWEIYDYSQLVKVAISRRFNDKIRKMVTYGTFILQPDLEVPLIGASLKYRIYYDDTFKEIADLDPELLYVLTKGKRGKAPDRLSVSYPTAGQTIMRSGWGRGRDFSKQTQLVFDVGPYRTSHSHLDALSFTLFSNGVALLPDSGLYTYEKEPHLSYFRSTRAHNTVIVDGKDQEHGAAAPGQFQTGDGYAHQSAQHRLYKGVTHKRAITLLGKNLVLVVDELVSDKPHTYEQLFHLFPEARIKKNGTIVSAVGKEPEHAATIHQLANSGIGLKTVKGKHTPPDGLYSESYEKAVPNYVVSYSKKGKKALYVTLIEIGPPDRNLQADLSTNNRRERIISIANSKYRYVVKVGKTSSVERRVKLRNRSMLPTMSWSGVEDFTSLAKLHRKNLRGSGGAVSLDNIHRYQGEPSVKIVSPSDGSWLAAVKDVKLNLLQSNLILRMRVSNRKNVKNLGIDLSTNNWHGYMSCDLKNAYQEAYEGEWITVSLGKGDLRSLGGQWRSHGVGFDWSKVDKVRFKISSVKGNVSTLNLDKFAIMPEQKEGAVVICFDDGHSTVASAAAVMKKYDLKGNIAVIAGRPREHAIGFLSLTQLKRMQNELGWNMINHSAYHKNALDTYYSKHDLASFEKDVLEGAEYLTKNDINSAPNWYIYPNGATNAQIKQVISKYYKFARTVQEHPEVFPFGDPLGVKVVLVHSKTSPSMIHTALADAKKYKHTLFLVFHRICTTKTAPSDSYYSVGDFEAVMQDIVSQGIKVKTLSELDADNQIPITSWQVTPEIPEQLALDVTRSNRSIFEQPGYRTFLVAVLSLIAVVVFRIVRRNKQRSSV